MLKKAFNLFKDAGIRFIEDRATLFAASMAYYTIFSLAPLLVIAVAIAGFFVGRSAAREEVLSALQLLTSPEVASLVQDIANQMVESAASATFTIVSIAFLIFGASGIFNSLRISINNAWGIAFDPEPGLAGIWATIKSRALTFVMVFIMGFMLVAVVVVELTFNAAQMALTGVLPGLVDLIPDINFLLAPAIAFITFLLIFKLLPDARISWRDALGGALFTAVAFGIGGYIIGRILIMTGSASVYGAASTLIILLLWVYYSAIIVLYGAELTYLYALRYGRPIEPDNHATYLAKRYANRFENRKEEEAE